MGSAWQAEHRRVSVWHILQFAPDLSDAGPWFWSQLLPWEGGWLPPWQLLQNFWSWQEAQ
jgi:hypothetical protein